MINIINLSYKENGTLNDAYYLKEINLNLPSCGLVIFTSDDKKSYLSLIKILVGLYPATKESKIIIDSEDFTKLKGEAKLSYINTNIGFISENSLLNPNLTIIDSIKLNSFLSKEEIDSTLEKLNLSLIRNKKISKLNDEEKECVCIAQAISKNPNILLVEPTITKNTRYLNLLKDYSYNHLVLIFSEDKSTFNDETISFIEFKNGQLFNSSIKNNEGKIFKREKKSNKLNFINTIKLTLSYLKRNIIQAVITLLLFITGLTLYGMSDTFLSFNYNKELTSYTLNHSTGNALSIKYPSSMNIIS